jgi:hypothetical protein
MERDPELTRRPDDPPRNWSGPRGKKNPKRGLYRPQPAARSAGRAPRKRLMPKDFEPLVRAVRSRISLKRNKRLRDALSEQGDPATVLDKELPGAVAAVWEGEHPDRQPPRRPEDIDEEALRALVRRVTRRLEKQADEGEDKVLRAERRAPVFVDEDEEQGKALDTLEQILKGADLTPREWEVYRLSLQGIGDDEIAELMVLERGSVTKTRYRMMKKLRESASRSGYSEKIKKLF